MMRVLNILLYGVGLGFGIGAASCEMWLASALSFVATAVGLFLFIRASLRRIY